MHTTCQCGHGAIATAPHSYLKSLLYTMCMHVGYHIMLCLLDNVYITTCLSTVAYCIQYVTFCVHESLQPMFSTAMPPPVPSEVSAPPPPWTSERQPEASGAPYTRGSPSPASQQSPEVEKQVLCITQYNCCELKMLYSLGNNSTKYSKLATTGALSSFKHCVDVGPVEPIYFSVPKQ